MSTYRRVTCIDRCHIFLSLNSGVSQSQISRELGFDKSTISREIARNKKDCGRYEPFSADKKALLRFKNCCRKRKISAELEDFVQYCLFQGWSPEQISGRLKFENSLKQVSHQAIYNFLHDQREDLLVLLKRHRRRGGGRVRQRAANSQGTKTIHERSQSVVQRLRRGDFERDCMRFSKTKEEVLVCTDRKTKFTKIAITENMRPKYISELTLKLLEKEKLKTLTNDNGLEFRDGKRMGLPVYYCDPGRPDQRGTVENTIGMLRTFLPKNSNPRDFDLKAIEDNLNNRPRKCLDYKTPYEVFYEKTVALAI